MRIQIPSMPPQALCRQRCRPDSPNQTSSAIDSTLSKKRRCAQTVGCDPRQPRLVWRWMFGSSYEPPKVCFFPSSPCPHDLNFLGVIPRTQRNAAPSHISKNIEYFHQIVPCRMPPRPTQTWGCRHKSSRHTMPESLT